MMRIRVPGNILLAGEYAVLEEGGLGLSMAVDEYVELDAEPDPALSGQGASGHLFVGIMGGASAVWTAGLAADNPLFAAVAAACDRVLREERGGGLDGPGLRITVDSRSFQYPDGRKRGLGSSAAACVAVAALLLRDLKDNPAYPDLVFRSALEGHRAVQGGRGSGYDVAASVFGGLGLFSGGDRPTYRRLEARELPEMTLLRGTRAVSTADAVRSWEAWKRRDGAAARRYREESDALVRELVDAGRREDFIAALHRAADLGRSLGAAIGVSAVPDDDCAECRDEGTGVKALGAGNELILAYSLYPLAGDALLPANGGFRWLED